MNSKNIAKRINIYIHLMNVSTHIAMESTERHTVYTPTFVICLMLGNEQRVTYYTLYIYVYIIYTYFVEEHFPLL